MIIYLLSFIDDETDRDFLASLYCQYSQRMYFKARQIISDDSLAEDAVQNAFIKIAKNIKRVRCMNEEHLISYLIIAAKNCAIDIIKKNSKEQASSCNTITNAAYDNTLYEKDEEQLFLYILSKLPEHHVNVMILYFVKGYSQIEISKLLGININTVRQHILRGRNKFIELYEKETEERKCMTNTTTK